MINHHKVIIHNKNNKIFLKLYVYKINFHIFKWKKYKIFKNVIKKIVKIDLIIKITLLKLI